MLNSCGNCCFLDSKCKGCARCLPKYLCASVSITPNPGFNMLAHPCMGHFTLGAACGKDPLSGIIRDPVPTWFGSYNSDVFPLSIGVVLVRNDSDYCTTIVTIENTGEYSTNDLEFTSTEVSKLPKMDFTVITPHGSMDIKIGNASVIRNPIADERCSPCTCASCIPQQLCFRFNDTTPYSFLAPNGDPDPTPVSCGCNSYVVADYDCYTREWGPVDIGCNNETVSVVISLFPADSNVCGALLQVSGEYEDFEQTIFFEGGPNHRWIDGIPCQGDGVELNINKPRLLPCAPEDLDQNGDCPDPPPQRFSTLIATSIYLGNNRTLYVSEATCGPCGLGVQGDCCGCLVLPDTMTLVFTTDCPDWPKSISLTYDGCFYWRGTTMTNYYPVADPPVPNVPVFFYYNPCLGNLSWEVFEVPGGTGGTPQTSLTCSPFVATFQPIGQQSFFQKPCDLSLVEVAIYAA